MKKKVKLLLGVSLFAVSISPVFIFNRQQKNDGKMWFEKTNRLNLEVRETFNLQKSLLSTDVEKKIDNDFELKLLLNHNFDSSDDFFDSKYIKEQNEEFIESLKRDGLNFIQYIISDETPIVWMYFDTEKQREEFVNKTKENKKIYKFILFKNTQIHTSQMVNYHHDWYYNDGYGGGYYYDDTKYDILNKDDAFKILNFTKQRERDLITTGSTNSRIGVFEINYGFNKSITNNFDKNGIEFLQDKYSTEKKHPILVSSIAAGDEGFDTKSKILFSDFTNKQGEWQKRLENMVKDRKLKLINHSYGRGDDTVFKLYNEESYVLDYLSRKYGVINVFSAGNENNDKEVASDKDIKVRGWINDDQLAYNSIVVGALNDNYNFNIKENRLADYSNYKLDPNNPQVAKPFVVAPGSYKFKYKNETQNGTSFAAPAITGIISTLLRTNPGIDIDTHRIPAVKSILSASSIATTDENQKINKNGFSNKYGAGIPNYEKMLIAVKNLNLITEDYGNTNNEISRNNIFFVEKGKTIKASLSWLFNAGLLNDKEGIPNYNPNVNWWFFLGLLGGTIANAVEIERLKKDTNNWNLSHKDEDWLKMNETRKRQDSWFSNYDLFLEKYNQNSGWKVIASSESTSSNDELITYKTTDSGNYRLVVRRKSSALFKNSVPDRLAFTYVIQD
ncbi:subtilase family protein [Mycoplasmopsis mustelae]|uniref:Subtilase family protein n=1 Tax=Mycoplasmopsis mustelae TaxID=171289 RepID=A0A4V3FNY7_9BACT|nr:S8 family serine peptidase [Mycoplasmopsis mustelae]TDV24300.1 subtilase family protein [Mycoplasmopsis mustelae]